MEEILSGEATPVKIAGFAVGLRTKGESVTELTGLVDTMYAHARVLDLPGRWLDVVGTGGERSMSGNISTMAALVAAGAGGEGNGRGAWWGRGEISVVALIIKKKKLSRLLIHALLTI